jgi:hypothetical protein
MEALYLPVEEAGLPVEEAGLPVEAGTTLDIVLRMGQKFDRFLPHFGQGRSLVEYHLALTIAQKTHCQSSLVMVAGALAYPM